MMRSRCDFPGKLAFLGAALALLAVFAAPAQALERATYSLEVLVDGVALTEYAARNKTYIEALEGREYSIRLTNRSGGRIAVALSVDGLNTIDAETTSARDGSKWILAPYQTITLAGWQTSADTARRFFFTTEQSSYGAWLGKTDNLGVVSAAVFRELPAPSAPIVQPRSEGKSGRRDSPARPSAPAERERSRSEAGARAEPDAAAPSLGEESGLSDRLAATGIGRETDHRVRQVRFESEKSPAAVLTLRYEYRDALVKLGVLPRPCVRHEDPLARRERARGFEGFAFAPDPKR